MSEPDRMAELLRLQKERLALELNGADTPEATAQIQQLKQREAELLATGSTAAHAGATAAPCDEVRDAG